MPTLTREEQLAQIGKGLETARQEALRIQNEIGKLPKGNGATVRMDYSTNPNGVQVAIDPNTGLDIPKEPTAGDLGLTTSTEQNNFNTEYDTFLKSQTKPFNEEDIRANTLKQFQAQIDATNKMYADELARARVQGTGRLGTQAAISARRGLAGSDFGEAQFRGVEDLNTGVEQSIEAERLAKISALMNLARSDAAAEIKAKRDAMISGYESRKQYYADQETRKTANTAKAVKNLIASGAKIKDLSATELSQLAKSYGITVAELKSAYADAEKTKKKEELETAKTQADIDKITQDIEKGTRDANKPIEVGGYIYKYNSETGEWVNSGTKASTGTGGLTPYQQFSATQSISKDTQARTEQAREMARQAQLIEQSYQNIEKGGDRSLNTQAIITSFNKILDPSSVVRESEYDRTAQGQSLLAQLQGKYQNIAQGGAGVTPETLKEASDIAKEYLKGAKKSVELQNERARQMAVQFGLNPDFVTSTGQITGKTIDDFRLEFPQATEAELQALMQEEQ